MSKQKNKFLILFMVFSFLVFIVSCTNKLNGQVSSNFKGKDSCSINLSGVSSKSEYNCLDFEFYQGEKKIYSFSNDDYGIYLYPLQAKDKNIKCFEYYDSPTGRKKVLAFNISEKQILRSEWFDDSAMGDSIDIKTITSQSLSFQVFKTNMDKTKGQYTVRFVYIKPWK